MSDYEKQYAQHLHYGRVEIVRGPLFDDRGEGWLIRNPNGHYLVESVKLLTFEPYAQRFHNVYPRTISRRGNATRQGADDNANMHRIAVLRKWQQEECGPWDCEVIKTLGKDDG